MRNELNVGSESLRQAVFMLRSRLEYDGHPAVVARFAAGTMLVGCVNEYDALCAAYRRAGCLVVSKRAPSLAGTARRFMSIHRTPDWESTAPFVCADGTTVG